MVPCVSDLLLPRRRTSLVTCPAGGARRRRGHRGNKPSRGGGVRRHPTVVCRARSGDFASVGHRSPDRTVPAAPPGVPDRTPAGRRGDDGRGTGGHNLRSTAGHGGERPGTVRTIAMTLPSISGSNGWTACRPRSHTRPDDPAPAHSRSPLRPPASATAPRRCTRRPRFGVFAGRPADVVVRRGHGRAACGPGVGSAQRPPGPRSQRRRHGDEPSPVPAAALAGRGGSPLMLSLTKPASAPTFSPALGSPAARSRPREYGGKRAIVRPAIGRCGQPRVLSRGTLPETSVARRPPPSAPTAGRGVSDCPRWDSSAGSGFTGDWGQRKTNATIPRVRFL